MRANSTEEILTARWRIILQWLALIALVLLLRPFQGIYHDANLYAVQALRSLGNDALGRDLYFSYGNQDDFSVFTLIYAPLIQALGLAWANMVAYGIGLFFWFCALVVFVHVFFEDRKARILALLGAVALSPAYASAFFSYGEGFVTPRVFAEGMGLLSCLTSALMGPNRAI
ncbi:hypothetical protein [Thalassovita sp.]|jgi:hypothetical protein|uniref:hypothetical protein n=1 Tax=Thalassovita sp. TaxID=1979401 RepID=UPI003B59664B